MVNSILKTENLCKSFNGNEILKDVNIEIFEKDAFVIIGRSGMGKSVLFKTILGLMKPTKGEIYINGKKTVNISEKERFSINRSISMVFQGSALFDSYNILENVTFGLQSEKLSKKEKIKIASNYLEQVDLDKNILTLYPSELSGGMQRRVALARAIATKPKIIFFDEPTSGLDPISSQIINNLIVSTTKNLGVTSIIITHDMRSAKFIGNRISLLHGGNIVFEGSPAEIETTNNTLVRKFIEGDPF